MAGGHRLDNRSDAINYVFGGQALFTLVSKRTGNRFTFSVKQGKQKWTDTYFVDVLNGSDNTANYAALGMVKLGGGFSTTRMSTIREDAPSRTAFRWLVERALVCDDHFAQCEVWHHGHCSRCGRLLTDNESIARGLGPVCAKRAV